MKRKSNEQRMRDKTLERERLSDLRHETERITAFWYVHARLKLHAGEYFGQGKDVEAHVIRKEATWLANDIAQAEKMRDILADAKRYATMRQLGDRGGGR
jgi:hypothetical protein